MKRISLWLLALLIGAGLILTGCGRKKAEPPAPSEFSVDNKKNGKIVVKAENAAKGSSAIGYLTLKEGQQMRVVSDLSNGSVRIKTLSDGDDPSEPLLDETLDVLEASYYELPAGEYSLEISAEKGTTGSVKIEPGGNATTSDGN